MTLDSSDADADGSRLRALFGLKTCSQDPISLVFPPPELCTGELAPLILSRCPLAEQYRQRGDDRLGIHASLHRR